MPFNINDPVQQEAFDRETKRLWNTAIVSNSFEFHTIEDVLKDLDKCQTTLDNDIADLKAGLKEVETGLKEVDTGLKEVDADVVDLKAGFNEVDIKVGDNQVDISLLQTNTFENTKAISGLHIAPLGSIIAWTPRPSANQATNMELPDGWVRCDGSVIPSPSIWAGMNTPDLNSDRRFLRGGNDNSALTFEDDMLQDHHHEDYGHSHQDTGHQHHVDPHDVFPDSVFLLHNNGYNTNYDNVVGKYFPNGEKPLAFEPAGALPSNIGQANIESSRANIGYPSSGSHGDETRPKNMAVVWIMRVY